MILVAKTLQYFAILAEIALNSGSGLIFALVKQPSFMVRATGIGWFCFRFKFQLTKMFDDWRWLCFYGKNIADFYLHPITQTWMFVSVSIIFHQSNSTQKGMHFFFFVWAIFSRKEASLIPRTTRSDWKPQQQKEKNQSFKIRKNHGTNYFFLPPQNGIPISISIISISIPIPISIPYPYPCPEYPYREIPYPYP